jgi:acyl-CoA reductase-like NAD-dependent aldehyde dehydrogenase
MIEIYNFINGEFIASENFRIIRSYKGENLARVYGVTPYLNRAAVRSAYSAKTELRNIDSKDLIEIVKLTAKKYLKEEDYENISLLSGSPIKYIREVFEELKKWCLYIEDYLKLCFGQDVNYDVQPIFYKDQIIGYKKFVPREIVTAILPANSAQVVIYTLPQILLSRNPAIVKPSSEGACAYATMKYLESFQESIAELGFSNLKNSFQMINILDKSQIKEIIVQNGQLLVFGSNESIEEIKNQIKETKISKIVQLGTGFSLAGVFEGSDLEHASKEIITSAIEDRGNQCTSISVVYVQESIYNEFLKSLERNKWLCVLGDPLHDKTSLGLIDKNTAKNIIKRFNDITGLNLKHEHPLGLKIFELEPHQHTEELPGPILVVKKITGIEDFIFHVNNDIKRNNMDKNLAISIFSDDYSILSKIAGRVRTHMLKFNKSTSNINFLLEHQGIYVVKELMDFVNIDINEPHSTLINI